MEENLKITKGDMESLIYLGVCFARSVVTINSGGYSDVVYRRALGRVVKIPFADEFVIELPDGTMKKFVAVPETVKP